MILIWDCEDLPPKAGYTIVLWRHYNFDHLPDAISIPEIVEKNSAILKAEYLSWIYELGEVIINNKKVIEHLEIRKGLSAWWMTLLTEKCNFAKSPQIENVIRLMTFIRWMKNRPSSIITLKSSNKELADSIGRFSNSYGHKFEWQQNAKSRKIHTTFSHLYRLMPYHIQAIAWLFRHVLHRWPLRGVGLEAWKSSEGKVTFISYLFNLLPEAAKNGEFESRYWTSLPKILREEKCKTNWLHIYIKDEFISTPGNARRVIRLLNEKNRGNQVHITLDSFLNINLIIKTIQDWWRLSAVSQPIEKILSSSCQLNSTYWPLIEKDWLTSTRGHIAMSNMLYLNLFEFGFRILPSQQRGVYLQENQGLEFALIHAWKANQSGKIIGAPHSTVRFWDLRYFFDRRSYIRSGNNDLPLPDRVALNGPESINRYIEGGYPISDLVPVEALRYLYLSEYNSSYLKKKEKFDGPLRLLVLGDYLPVNTMRQLNLLQKALIFLNTHPLITVKPHPACPINPSDYPSLSFKLTTSPLSILLDCFDVAYTSSSTSAGVDAYCCRLPVVSLLDPNILNLSPLRGLEGVIFASTPMDLAYALNLIDTNGVATNSFHQYFHFGDKLNLWRNLLLDKEY